MSSLILPMILFFFPERGCANLPLARKQKQDNVAVPLVDAQNTEMKSKGPVINELNLTTLDADNVLTPILLQYLCCTVYTQQ